MKILIADKSNEIREKVKKLLKGVLSNAQIEETESNLEGMSKSCKHKPDLLITDLELYEGTGFNLLSFITNINPASTRIVFTNHLNMESLSRENGANHFFSKSGDLLKLKSILGQVLLKA